MTKAINWPARFLNDVINENPTDTLLAIRLGTIYYDHCYYVPDEVVDIRVNHKVVRQGIIVGDMKLCKLKDLSEDDLKKEKAGLKTIDELVKYLAQTYGQEVTPDEDVTVVYYRNLNAQETADRVDDPHM